MAITGIAIGGTAIATAIGATRTDPTTVMGMHRIMPMITVPRLRSSSDAATTTTTIGDEVVRQAVESSLVFGERAVAV